MSKVSVKKIVLEIAGKELSLSVEDAKALRAALNEVLGASQTQYVPYPYSVPWVKYYPTYTNTTGATITTTTPEYPPTAYVTCGPTATLSS